MASTKTTTTASSSTVSDEMLLSLLMGSQKPQSTLLKTASDIAAKSMSSVGVIAGAFVGAGSNFVQRYELERNFRQAEIAVERHHIAAQYLARLKAAAK
jgi:hypothetical protein